MLVSAPAVSLRAEVVRIDVTSRADISVGSRGTAGAYEELSGRIFFAIDPRDDANRIIADVDKAPLDAAGRIELSANFILLKPKQSPGNRTLLFEVSNRGSRLLSVFFDRSALSGEGAGDGFLMQQGYTMLWVGWQFDVPDKPGALQVDVPAAREADGRTIHGLVRSDAANKGQWLELADRGHEPYPFSDPASPFDVLTVRDCIECPRQKVPRTQWQLSEDRRRVFIASGEPRKIYELVYVSGNPPVAGLGLAAVRDALSKLRYAAVPELSLEKGAIERVVGFGASQSGRFLRTYIYEGFNEDESGRRVFDGVISLVAGAGRGSFNQRFAQPSRDGHPYLNFFYPTDIFPFTDIEQLDAETGRRDGLMTQAAGKPLPKFFHINTSYEYWGRSASLIHTSVDGLSDAPTLPNVRLYFFAGAKHAPGGEPAFTDEQQQLTNPLDYRWGLRKLLVDMNRWVTDDTPPPPSVYPRIDNGTLVPPQRLAFPGIPHVGAPGTPKQAYRADYGPDFRSKGIAAHEPPKLGSPFPVLVPQVDADGNEIAGIRLPELAVPLATYTGWAHMHSTSGLQNTLTNGTGSFIPFQRTRCQREQAHDPRRSIDERYESREHYLSLVARSAGDLAEKGYLLASDIPGVVEQAGARWDFLFQ